MARSPWQNSNKRRKYVECGKKGQATWEECRNVIRVYRDIKDNNKDFFKYISSKRKMRENVGPLLNGVGALVMKDTEKTDL